MIDKTLERFNDEVYKKAKSRVIKKLEDQGVNLVFLVNNEVEELVTDEMEILKSETKKIGIAAGVSIGISLFIGI